MFPADVDEQLEVKTKTDRVCVCVCVCGFIYMVALAQNLNACTSCKT